MKKNQMEVMRAARNKALKEGVTFYTMNLAHPSGKKKGGNIIAAYRQLDGKDFELNEFQQSLLRGTGVRLFRVQYSFCAPYEKNPSRIFGEGQAALRFFNDKSALVLQITPNGNASGGKLSQGLRAGALQYAAWRGVPWIGDAKIQDLV